MPVDNKKNVIAQYFCKEQNAQRRSITITQKKSRKGQQATTTTGRADMFLVLTYHLEAFRNIKYIG